MDLRTITIGIPINIESDTLLHLESKLKNFLEETTIALATENINIRTFRINLTPVTNKDSNLNSQKIIGKIETFSNFAEKLNIRWINIPYDLTENPKELSELAFTILKRYPKTFSNLIVAKDKNISYNAIPIASKFIKDVSKLDNSGYNNFRVGVSCNIKANTPFFPYTYSSEELGISTGLELPKEFIKIINSSENRDLISLREEIITKISPEVNKINNILSVLAKKHFIKYNGIDFSLAPYPEKGSSVAELIELLGLEQLGSNGTLFLTSYLTDILKEIQKRNNTPTTGFNGVMFSLLEDEQLGLRNNNKLFSIDSLISYSAVCGCGLDMIPLPGDIFEEELNSIILDVAALSTTLDKPLGVRVLPIPTKQENEFTTFNMDFLFNTRVKKPKNLSLSNRLLTNTKFSYLKWQ
ncbi:DUF711 family protein [archaeon]|jgi:uncharacterized protein|nr:DUF711 family protein [archaeon]MBT3730442.1 DUF711 family protein [archaeon]MBT4670425.1 DUF711 family protein [archaeon]MBT5288199.1 DUF711 family protein [archaeon]MBT7053194.1 DUF711 family protein [archaeon]